MFTGIVEEQGLVQSLTRKPNLCVIQVRTRRIGSGIKIGDSVSVNGACLTVTAIRRKILTFEIMLETIRRTTLQDLQKGSRVNLERSLKAGGRFDGHFVTGHVDDVGKVIARTSKKNYVEFWIAAGKKVVRYIVPKGSVCVDGVSLTVGEVKKDKFSVHLIPHTLKVTTLSVKCENDTVNIETDILAKYILGHKKS